MKIALVLLFASTVFAGPKSGAKKEVSKNVIRPDPDDGKVRSPEYNSRSVMREKITAAIKDYNDYTCVRWVERKRETDYVFIHGRNSGCYARLGRQGGQQELNLQNPTDMPGGYTVGCHVKGIVIHEMLHTIGFAHEQSRSDRDRYITINWDNIEKDSKSQFDKMEAGTENDMGMQYDYDSVMHYEQDAFAIDSDVKVITTKSSKDQKRIGQRAGFSTQDVKEVNTLYKCRNGKSGIGGVNGCTDNPNIEPSCKEIVASWGPNACSRSDVLQYCKLSCKKC